MCSWWPWPFAVLCVISCQPRAQLTLAHRRRTPRLVAELVIHDITIHRTNTPPDRHEKNKMTRGRRRNHAHSPVSAAHWHTHLHKYLIGWDLMAYPRCTPGHHVTVYHHTGSDCHSPFLRSRTGVDTSRHPPQDRRPSEDENPSRREGCASIWKPRYSPTDQFLRRIPGMLTT